jgi:hypothetical protein
MSNKTYIIIEKIIDNPKIKCLFKFCNNCNALKIDNKQINIKTFNIDLRFLAIKIIPKDCHFKNIDHPSCFKCIKKVNSNIEIDNIKVCTNYIYDQCNDVAYIHLLLPNEKVCSNKFTLNIKNLDIFFSLCKENIIKNKEIVLCTIPPRLLEDCD